MAGLLCVNKEGYIAHEGGTPMSHSSSLTGQKHAYVGVAKCAHLSLTGARFAFPAALLQNCHLPKIESDKLGESRALLKQSVALLKIDEM